MTQQSISILKDCELWCDFDSQYVDAQRGIVRDRSGHGRHPVAKGGPTFGQNGPDSFEAVSLDGVDDEFVTENISVQEQTDISLVKIDGNQFGEITNWITTDGGGYVRWNDNVQRFQVRLVNNSSSDTFQVNSQSGKNLGQFYLVGLRWDGSELQLIIDGEVEDSIPLTDHDETIGEPYVIGNSKLNGTIVFTGRWSRALSTAEIDYLNRLTAPRRSNV
jgi:hypothetical protein